jgi:CheY-like chemotaxis protein
MEPKRTLDRATQEPAPDPAEETGCDGYLAKPVEPRHVVEEVRWHLGDASSASE